MQTYLYEGRNNLGERMKGRIESASSQAVAKWLLEAEIAPIRIREIPKAAPQPAWFLKLSGQDRVPILDLQMLTRQLANMVRAGMPLMLAIDGIRRSTTNKALERALGAIRDDLDRGSDMSAAFARHPNVFDSFYVNMVRVGESSGKLDEAFRALYQQIEFDRDIRKKVKSAVRYPSFVLGALVLGLAALMLFVIPVFERTYKGFHAELPPVTQVLIAVSTFARSYWWLVGIFGVVGWLAFKRWIASARGRYLFDRTMTRAPIIGSIIKKSCIARFCRNFSMGIRSGVPLVPALELAGQVVGNAFYEQRIMQMRRGIERGDSFTRVATGTGVFSPMEIQMISVGEASGEVDEMMDQIAQIHAEDMNYEVSRLSETVEPILLAIMGLLVGTLLLGVFSPLWNLGEATLHSSPH